jgi:hypothetical protein
VTNTAEENRTFSGEDYRHDQFRRYQTITQGLLIDPGAFWREIPGLHLRQVFRTLIVSACPFPANLEP